MLIPKSHYLHTADVKKSKFDPVLRTQYPSPPSEFVEFHYDSYAVPFPRSKLKKYSSLIANLQDGNILSIPAKSKTVFFAFYSYIKSGDYPPELVTITTPYFTAAKADGPPSISTYLPDAENYLALDVQMFNLASTLKFPELRDKALERMRSMSETHADPIAVLEEIYGKNIKNEEDKNQLRAWARDFLLKLHQGSDLINLQILEQSEQWGERFSKLAGQDSLFRSDCDVVIKDWITNRALLFIGATKKESSKDEDGASVKKFLSNSDLEFLQQHNPAISVLYQEEKRKRDKEKKTDVKKQKDVEGISNEKKTGDDEHTHTTIPCQCQACFQRAAEHYGWHNAASAAHHFFSRPIPPVAYPPIPQPTYTAQGDFPYYFPFS
ncbi:hypothetical protein FQN57_003727 [Myotisia sp. PD_48]|nr:hypothetical protein FQN57_003727 [Myotisia sp. PD_48]